MNTTSSGLFSRAQAMNARQAWALIAAGVLGYEVVCKDGQLLSQCVDEWLVSKPILTRGAKAKADARQVRHRHLNALPKSAKEIALAIEQILQKMPKPNMAKARYRPDRRMAGIASTAAIGIATTQGASNANSHGHPRSTARRENTTAPMAIKLTRRSDACPDVRTRSPNARNSVDTYQRIVGTRVRSACDVGNVRYAMSFSVYVAGDRVILDTFAGRNGSFHQTSATIRAATVGALREHAPYRLSRCHITK